MIDEFTVVGKNADGYAVCFRDLSRELQVLIETALRHESVYKPGDNHGEGCGDCLSYAVMKFVESVEA